MYSLNSTNLSVSGEPNQTYTTTTQNTALYCCCAALVETEVDVVLMQSIFVNVV